MRSRVSGALSGHHNRLIDIDLLDEPGTRFNIEILLGEGTFGEVHRALDTQTNKALFTLILCFFQTNSWR